MDNVECIVIGGGAAGIGAARTLADAGRRVLIVEAANRLGGRAHSVHVAGMPLDLGCGWLHSAPRNPWVGIAEAHGFALDRGVPRWREQWRDLGADKTEQAAAWQAYGDMIARMESAAPPSDRVGDLVARDDRWRPNLDALSGFINGAPIDEMSVADWLAYDEASIAKDWRVIAGYGTLVASHAAGVLVTLATPVRAIDRSGRRLRIETERGSIAADAAIVTVSTDVLASGAIAIADHEPIFHAASRLPLGLADKLFFAIGAQAEAFDEDAHLLGNPRSAATGTYTLRPFGRPVIECMLGGTGAREAEALGLAGAAAFALDELCALLGNDWRTRLTLVAGSAWGREDYVRGGYSHALPGARGERAVLATPVDPRIRFAGEACSSNDFSTAHGAYETGVAAARALIESY